MGYCIRFCNMTLTFQWCLNDVIQDVMGTRMFYNGLLHQIVQCDLGSFLEKVVSHRGYNICILMRLFQDTVSQDF
jgi:hypothetical protein